jgi:hypothetical protein
MFLMFTPPFAAFDRKEKKGYNDFPLNQDCLTFDLC